MLMLQFPAPLPPGEIPPLTCLAQFILCVALVGLSTALLSFFLPRPLFCKLFKIAFPFMPDQLEDFDEKD
jgi:hypothetical protein